MRCTYTINLQWAADAIKSPVLLQSCAALCIDHRPYFIWAGLNGRDSVSQTISDVLRKSLAVRRLGFWFWVPFEVWIGCFCAFLCTWKQVGTLRWADIPLKWILLCLQIEFFLALFWAKDWKPIKGPIWVLRQAFHWYTSRLSPSERKTLCYCWNHWTTATLTYSTDQNQQPFSALLKRLNTQKWEGENAELCWGWSSTCQCMDRRWPVRATLG